MTLRSDQTRAIIFDVDGTLAETEEIHRRSFNDAFAASGVDRIWPDSRRGWIWSRTVYRRLLDTTGGKERIAAYLEADLRIDSAAVSEVIAVIHAAKTARFAALLREEKLAARPGIERIIAGARQTGVRLAVATTTTRLNVEALCKSLFARPAGQLFDVIAAGDEVRLKKPAPDVYHLALRHLALPAAACIALEDSRNGLLAAKAAGLRCVVSPSLYTAGDDFHEADRLVEQFDWPDIAAMLTAAPASPAADASAQNAIRPRCVEQG